MADVAPDPIDDYFKTISPYDQAPAKEEPGLQAPKEPLTVGGQLSRVGRDLGVYAGHILPGAATIPMLPVRAGLYAGGYSQPSESDIERYTVPSVLQPRTPEEQRFAAAGRGTGVGLPLMAFPPTRNLGMQMSLGGTAGGYASEMAQQAFPNQPWVGPAVGAGVGMMTGMAPGIGSLPNALGALRRGMGAIDLGYLRSIALEHSAPAWGQKAADALGIPGAGPFLGGMIHWGPVIAPPAYNIARRILGASGAIPGAIGGGGAGYMTEPSNALAAPQ